MLKIVNVLEDSIEKDKRSYWVLIWNKIFLIVKEIGEIGLVCGIKVFFMLFELFRGICVFVIYEKKIYRLLIIDGIWIFNNLLIVLKVF